MEKEPTPQITIREAVAPDEVVPARIMHAESWLAAYPNEPAGVSEEWVRARTDRWLEPEQLEKSKEILARILDDPSQFYRLAEQQGEIVGFIHLMTKQDGSKHLEAIYTSPETFGTGVGASLMDAANQWIGGDTVTLEVVSYNERARRFYEKYGFRVIQGSDHLYADKLPVIEMKREGKESQ